MICFPAVGGSMTFEKMDQIREQQEQLARLHFEMDIQQDMQRSAGVKVKYHNVAIFCYKIFYELIMGTKGIVIYMSEIRYIKYTVIQK